MRESRRFNAHAIATVRAGAPVAKERILVAEDETSLRDVLCLQLKHAGYDVIESVDGEQALELATRNLPDLILLDVMMPKLTGFEVCEKLRESFATRHIPIIILTAKAELTDKVTGLEGGANDYVTKPWARKELLQRIKNALEWSRQQRSASPLTGLPGNASIDDEIKRRFSSEKPFAMLQADIDYFKAFNDHYGYSRGDVAIQTLARILLEEGQRHGERTFVGHIGGDDFVMLTEPQLAEKIGRGVLAAFDRAVPTFYDPEDLERGYVEVQNRLHVPERFPLMSLTLTLVITDQLPGAHLAQLADRAQELKARGKGIAGSVLVSERRSIAGGAGEQREDAA
jgi:PleD family two-component response regulator